MEAKASGMPDLGVWVTPHPVAGKSGEALRQEADKAIDDIIRALTRPREKKGKEVAKESNTITFEGTDFFETFERFNRHCLQERWGDGLPLVPPTREKVAWMLTGTDRSLGDKVVMARPSGRIVTVEAVAINAVMAGALPAYMPVIITALEAWDECPFGWGSVTTTSPAAPLVVVKGPIAKQLDINSKSNAAGYGWRANTTIGRTIELIFKTVGGAIPGITDMSITGDARTITSTVVAENEDVLNDIGWPSYAETLSLPKDANILTIGPAFWGFEEIWIKADSPEELLRCLIWEVSTKVREGIMGWGGGLFLLMSPEHAPITTSRGWAFSALRRAGRTPPGRSCFIRNSIKPPWRIPAATTTAWTRPRGTNNGWAIRSGRGTPSVEHRKRRQAARPFDARDRRVGHECPAGKHISSRGRPDQSPQRLRFYRSAQRFPDEEKRDNKGNDNKQRGKPKLQSQ